MSAALTIMAFDYGERRIGVAVGQTVTGSAQALRTLTRSAQGTDWESIGRLVAEWRPGRFAVGQPRHLDGREHELAPAIRRFGAELGTRYGCPVDIVDERLSSVEAEGRLTERKRARGGGRTRHAPAEIDAEAACVIAEQWLAEHPS